MTRKWTPARKRALEVLCSNVSPRISNETTAATIHWQTADWLCAQGFARLVIGRTGDNLCPYLEAFRALEQLEVSTKRSNP